VPSQVTSVVSPSSGTSPSQPVAAHRWRTEAQLAVARRGTWFGPRRRRRSGLRVTSAIRASRVHLTMCGRLRGTQKGCLRFPGWAEVSARTRITSELRLTTRVTAATLQWYSALMMSANHTFSHPVSPDDDIHGTAWIQNAASTGRKHGRRERAAMLGPVPLPQIQSPLRTDMIREIVADYETGEASKDHFAARGIGGVLGFHLARAAMRRRGWR
jgi:hypothetical protein